MLARLGCWRRPLYRPLAAGCRCPNGEGKSPEEKKSLLAKCAATTLSSKQQRKFLKPKILLPIELELKSLKENAEISVCPDQTATIVLHGGVDLFALNLKNSKIVPGGADIDMEVSKRLRQHHRQTISGRSQFFVNSFAKAFQVFPRHFSSKSESEDNNTDTCSLEVFELKKGDKDNLLEKISMAVSEMDSDLQIDILQFREYRQQLALNFLLLPSHFDDERTAFLYHTSYSITGRRKPTVISALDLVYQMRLLKTRNDRIAFMDQITSDAVLVSGTFEKTYGNIEMVRYSTDSPLGDASIFGLECDHLLSKGLRKCLL